MNGSAPPEAGVEQHQQGEEFPLPKQHGQHEGDFGGIAKRGEGVRRAKKSSGPSD